MSTEIVGVIVTGGVGLLGFMGIIITLFCSAHLSRRDQKAQWKHEEDRRDQQQRFERNSLRAGLLHELRLASRHVEIMISHTEKANHKQGAVLPVGISDGVYRSSIARIGLLSESDVKRVIVAYGAIRAQGDFLKARYDLDPQFEGVVHVPADRASFEIESWRHVLEHVHLAVKAMADSQKVE